MDIEFKICTYNICILSPCTYVVVLSANKCGEMYYCISVIYTVNIINRFPILKYRIIFFFLVFFCRSLCTLPVVQTRRKT